MGKLLRKEFVLTAQPITYFFILFSFMGMIPKYPILVGGFFVCLGIMYSFQFAREYNDTLYTALLPVKKSDVVKAKYSFVVSIQVISLLINTVVTIIRMFFLSEASQYKNNTMMNANFSFLGYIL